MPPSETPSSLTAGVLAQALGSICIVGTVTCLKRFHVGLTYELAVLLLAMFVPSVCIVLYFHARKSSSQPNANSNARNLWAGLFTDRRRLAVGAYTLGYFALTYSAYRLLPITLAMPLFVTYPIMDVFLSSWVNGTPLPTWKQSGAIALLVVGVAAFFYDAIGTVMTPTVVGGIVLGVLGALSMALRMIYTAHRPTAGAPVRARQDIQLAHPDAHTVEVLGVQMLETSTLACIVFVVLACVLMCVPESWLGQLRAWGVPDALTDRSVRGGAPTLLIMFVCFVVLSFGGNTLLIAADDRLPTQVYASGVYLMVLFSVIAGYMFLGESATPAKLVGLALVLTGGGLLVYWRDRVDASATRERTDERIARRA